MQTFLPYPDFRQSAEVLDKKRCWKQVVEASQILDVLEGRKIGWINHPVVKMWEGYIHELKIYFNAFLKVCKHKHKINTKYKYFQVVSQYMVQNYEMPWWLGNPEFHRAMRSRLIEKNRDFYFPLFPEDEGFNGGKYFWPDNKTKSLKII